MAKNSVALAKLNRPKPSAALPRERLFRLLDELRDHPILWIGGGPGAGKTTLIASYLEARQLPAIWHHVDSEDGDPEALFKHLQVADVRCASRTAKSLPRSSGDGPAYSLGVRRRFLRELYNRLPQPGVLILDDCHEVAHDAPLHSLLADLAREIPRDINVILIGRGEPPSLYTRLIANRTLAVLDSRDLQLTEDETRAIASEILTDERVLAALHSQCEGWAAGVAVTVELLRRNGAESQHIEQEVRRAAFNYFAGEVFDRATREERRVLVSTALVPRVSAQMAEELSGSAQAQPLLSRLASRQLFTCKITSQPSTYEYSPLFREFLLTRVEDTLAPQEFTELASRASAILEKCGDLEASAALHVRARNWASLLRMICKHGMRLLAQGHSATVRRWIDTVPEDVVSNSPWLAYWSGAASILDSPVAARALLEKAWTRFEERAVTVGQLLAAAAILETYQFEWESYAPAARWIDRIEAHLASDATLPSHEAELHVYANLLFALTHVRPAPKLAAICIARLRELLNTDVHVNHRLFAARSLLVAYVSRLDVDASRDVTRRLRPMLQEQGCSPAARAAALNAVAYSRWLECDFSDAEAVLREAMSVANDHQLNAMDPLHHVSRHLLALARRDRPEMADCVDILRRAAGPTCHLGMSILSRALGEQALVRGDLAAAVNHWIGAVSRADEACARPMQWISRLALSGCLAIQGDCTRAAQILQQARALADGDPSEAWLRDHEMLAAHVALRRDDRVECHRRLRAALATAQHTRAASQVCMLFPVAMAELCMEALHAGIAIEAVRNLIQHYQLPPPANADREWPWPFEVHVLGRFRLLKDDAPIRFSRRTQRKPLELLQALIAFGGTDIGAGTLTDALWPDSEGDAGYHALESALYRLRQLLGAPDAITMAGGKLSLNPRQFWVDKWAFERELQMGTGRVTDAAGRLARIRQLYEGHFLEQETEKPWALNTRQALRDKFVRSIRDAARTYESRRLWQEAASIYQTGIELDALAEDLYRGLMVCHRELGDHTEALQAYRQCRELLVRVLGVQPNAKTQAIYHSVRQSAVAHTA
jgi:LuxR family transcriptional regulator, maltose regulon positive regulatory protein